MGQESAWRNLPNTRAISARGVAGKPHSYNYKLIRPGGCMFSTPYIAGKTIEILPSLLSDVVNPANQKPFAKVFMAHL
jgi:hypothetical protein